MVFRIEGELKVTVRRYPSGARKVVIEALCGRQEPTQVCWILGDGALDDSVASEMETVLTAAYDTVMAHAGLAQLALPF